MFLLMDINGRKFLSKVIGLYTIKGLEGDVLVEFASGGKAIIPKLEVDEMYAKAQKVLSGDRTDYVPAK